MVLSRSRALMPTMQARAAGLDEGAVFPSDDLADLQAAGVLLAPLPPGVGGLGIGTDPAMAEAAVELFCLLGEGNLALGRLVEAHVNALRLVVRYGGADLVRRVASDAATGHLFGLWVTDPPGDGVKLADGALWGGKQFCSGAGHVTRAVLTARDAGGETVLAYAAVEGAAAIKLPQSLAGMRAATTGQMRFDGTPGVRFGEVGDYLREPDFSCGAWRTSAVTLGGIAALTEQLRRQLVGRGRQGDPHQQARFGQALIATETARLWVQSAAGQAEAADAGAQAVAYVGLARLAVERAAFEVIELAQRSLGVAALQRGNPVERISRDLATYLRQPAGDMVLAEAAAASMARPIG